MSDADDNEEEEFYDDDLYYDDGTDSWKPNGVLWQLILIKFSFLCEFNAYIFLCLIILYARKVIDVRVR